MKIENLIRYTGLAVGLKPSARQDEACLRGLDQTNSNVSSPCWSVISVSIHVLFQRLGRTRLRGLFPTNPHPRWSPSHLWRDFRRRPDIRLNADPNALASACAI